MILCFEEAQALSKSQKIWETFHHRSSVVVGEDVLAVDHVAAEEVNGGGGKVIEDETAIRLRWKGMSDYYLQTRLT